MAIGRELVGAGCPLDYLESLPGNPSATPKLLYIRQEIDHAQSKIRDLGDGRTVYIIRFAVGTGLRAGVVISSWSLEPPWNHDIDWNQEPCDVIRAEEYPAYERLLDSRLTAVLHGHLLTCGHPVDGLICGIASASIPETVAHGQTVYPKLNLTTGAGYTISFRLSVSAYGKGRTSPLLEKPDLVEQATAQKATPSKRRAPLFEKPDRAEQTAVCNAR